MTGDDILTFGKLMHMLDEISGMVYYLTDQHISVNDKDGKIFIIVKGGVVTGHEIVLMHPDNLDWFLSNMAENGCMCVDQRYEWEAEREKITKILSEVASKYGGSEAKK